MGCSHLCWNGRFFPFQALLPSPEALGMLPSLLEWGILPTVPIPGSESSSRGAWDVPVPARMGDSSHSWLCRLLQRGWRCSRPVGMGDFSHSWIFCFLQRLWMCFLGLAFPWHHHGQVTPRDPSFAPAGFPPLGRLPGGFIPSLGPHTHPPPTPSTPKFHIFSWRSFPLALDGFGVFWVAALPRSPIPSVPCWNSRAGNFRIQLQDRRFGAGSAGNGVISQLERRRRRGDSGGGEGTVSPRCPLPPPLRCHQRGFRSHRE